LAKLNSEDKNKVVINVPEATIRPPSLPDKENDKFMFPPMDNEFEKIINLIVLNYYHSEFTKLHQKYHPKL
jgi:hypothetical protein